MAANEDKTLPSTLPANGIATETSPISSRHSTPTGVATVGLVEEQDDYPEEIEKISLLASHQSFSKSFQENNGSPSLLKDTQGADSTGEEETEDDKDSLLSDDSTSSSTITNSNNKCLEILGLQSFLSSYRSTNPQKRITPFAVILLLVLLILYILNQADRLVLAVLIPSGLRCNDNSNITNASDDSCPLPSSLNSSINNTIITNDCVSFDDTEQGLLTGPAFVIVYVLAGLPLAYLADTRSRPLVLLVGVGFWSVMVFLTGFVNKFWELLLLRILLGVGEASFNPVAYSLMADFFPVHNRASVFAIYNYGVYFGGSFGWMSGAITGVLDWRWTFRILGIAGMISLPLALLAMWEPKRIKERRKKRLKGKSVYSVWEVFKYLIKCPPFLLLLVAGSIRNIPGYALGYWLPTYYTKVFGVSSHDYGPKVGLVVLFGGGIGCFIGGVLSDWLSRHRQGAKAFIISASQLLAAPAIVGVLIVNSPSTSYGLLVIAYITAETWLGPAAAIVQDITPPAMRAQASAVYIGIISIVASIGPVLVPFFQHNIPTFESASCLGLRYALLCTVPTFYFISSILFVTLGLVMKYWAQKHKNKKGSYAIFTDAISNERSSTDTTVTRSSPSNEW